MIQKPDRPWLDDQPREKFYASRRPAKCPKCGSQRVARIQHGLPVYTEKLKRDLDEGRVVLGGCCATREDASWKCVDCGQQVWRKKRP